MKQITQSLTVLSIVIASIAAAQNTQAVPKRKALVIGNSAYRLVPAIPIPEKNAAAVRRALTDLGFETREVSNLDQAGILSETKEFINSIQAGDIVFFYFSGYGMQFNEVNLLLPTNFDPVSDQHILNQAFDIQVLLSGLEEKKPSSRIIVIDASRQAPSIAAKASGEGLARMDDVEAKTLIAFSAQYGHSTADRLDERVGVFTQSLIDALRTPGSKPVTVFDAVQRDVLAKTGEQQNPYYISSAPGDFYFAPPLPVVSAEGPTPLTAATTRENPVDGLSYAWVPAGSFQMGCVPDDSKCKPDESPRHAVNISAGFWMTKTEVTISAYERFTLATGHEPPGTTKTNQRGVYTEHPVTKITADAAAAYCKWVGGRLPTEAEWEYAARGAKDAEIYPWGNEFDLKLTNSYQGGKRKGPFQETLPVRRYPANAFGLFDMVGNVREWTSDYYNPTAYSRAGAQMDPEERTPAKGPVARGGSFNGSEKDLRISARDHPTVPSDNQTGFRCTVASLI